MPILVRNTGFHVAQRRERRVRISSQKMNGRQPRIDTYSFGSIEIDGRTYTADVIILPAGVRSDWWRDQGHTLKPGDLTEVLEASPHVVVIGQGAHGLMRVTEETLTCLKQAGIEAICVPTVRAVEVYNQRSQRGERVAAALHLTC